MQTYPRRTIPAMLAAGALSARAADDSDDRMIVKILSQRQPGGYLPEEQAALVKRLWAKNHPSREFIGATAITDLGARTYRGEQGGLYAEGRNTPPESHRDAGMRLAQEVTPLDREGRRAGDGRIVFLSIALTGELPAFQKQAAAEALNSRLVLVDCFQPGKGADNIAAPEASWWDVVFQRLGEAGAGARQVQVLWLKPVLPWPWRGFPAEARTYQECLAAILRHAKECFPNLKLAYVSSRIYAGYALTPQSPEPYCYETAFSVKWLIADQIAGKPELNYDPAKGSIRCPWLAWGPYLWADGTKGRGDGLSWLRSDFAADGMHPSQTGKDKIGRGLLDFLKREPTAHSWFLR